MAAVVAKVAVVLAAVGQVAEKEWTVAAVSAAEAAPAQVPVAAAAAVMGNSDQAEALAETA